MIIERTKNATRNIIFGILLRIYQIIIPFILRTVLIYTLGMDYLGLDSLFVSILQILNLAELGVGSAMVFSMYKPIIEDDEITICALLKLYKIYYRVIGLVILVVGLLIMPLIPNLIKSDLPAGLNVYVLYSMNLLATVFSYWLFAYKNSLLIAHQREDVNSKIKIIVLTVRYVFQFIILIWLRDYYIYIMITLMSQLLQNIVTAIIVKKMYPNYKPQGKIQKEKVKEINDKIKDLFVTKIGGIMISAVDTVVISTFLGLTALAMYQNYYYIITALTTCIGVVFTACTAGIGNSIIVETNEKNYKDLKKFTFMIVWISGCCTICLITLYQPFMELWVGKEYMLDFFCVICFALYFFVYEINTLLNTYKDASGIWKKDKFRVLVTSLTNLVLNLLLINYIGIYGIILSTVVSIVFVGIPWQIKNLFDEVFKMSFKDYVKTLIGYVVFVCILAIITYLSTSIIRDGKIIYLIIKAIMCIVIFNIIWIIRYNQKDEMKYVLNVIKNTIIKK